MSELTKGFIRENPIFILMLGLCPSLAVSTQVVNALGMSAGTIFVLLGSNIMVALLKNFIPDEIHIPAYIVIIATFVTLVDLLMQAYAPALSKSLGVFVQLIVVNCIILGRAEAFASKNSVKDSITDALSMGFGFFFGLTLIALIREVLEPEQSPCFLWETLTVLLNCPDLFPLRFGSYPFLQALYLL